MEYSFLVSSYILSWTKRPGNRFLSAAHLLCQLNSADFRQASMLPLCAKTADDPRSKVVMCYVTCPWYHTARAQSVEDMSRLRRLEILFKNDSGLTDWKPIRFYPWFHALFIPVSIAGFQVSSSFSKKKKTNPSEVFFLTDIKDSLMTWRLATFINPDWVPHYVRVLAGLDLQVYALRDVKMVARVV